MKEFIEKLIERLEMEENKWSDFYNSEKRKGEINHYADGRCDGITVAIGMVEELAEEYEREHIVEVCNQICEKVDHILQKNNNDWIPVEERLPETDKYILLSFSNYTVPVIGRYEEDKNGGTFYIGDDLESCSSHYLFVNAWCPLPKPYEPEEPKQIPTDHFMERFNRVV